MTENLALAYIKQEMCRAGKDYQIEARDIWLRPGETVRLELKDSVFFIISETPITVRSGMGVYDLEKANEQQHAHTGEAALHNPTAQKQKIWAVQGIAIIPTPTKNAVYDSEQRVQREEP